MIENEIEIQKKLKQGIQQGYLPSLMKTVCSDKNIAGKTSTFVNATNSNSVTQFSYATEIPLIGDFLIYIEKSANNYVPDVYSSFERTDIIQTDNFTLSHNSFSAPNNKSMRRFRIQPLLDNQTWSTRYNIPKKDR